MAPSVPARASSNFPRGLAVWNRFVFVADRNNRRVQVGPRARDSSIRYRQFEFEHMHIDACIIIISIIYKVAIDLTVFEFERTRTRI